MLVRSKLAPGVFSSGTRLSFSVQNIVEQAKPLLLTAAVIGYVLIIFELGYYTSSFLFLIIIAYVVGVRNLKTIALTAIVTLPLMYAFFELFLKAQMPRGVLL